MSKSKVLSTRAIARTTAVLGIILVIAIAAVAGYFVMNRPTAPTTPITATTLAPGPTTLVVDKANELQSVDPGFDYEYAGWEVIANLYDPLVTYDMNNSARFVGRLAD